MGLLTRVVPQGQESNRWGVACAPGLCARLRAVHGSPVAASPAQPDPLVGAAGPHRRLDRPPARGDGPADPVVQARERPRARRRRRRGRPRRSICARRTTPPSPPSSRPRKCGGARRRPARAEDEAKAAEEAARKAAETEAAAAEAAEAEEKKPKRPTRRRTGGRTRRRGAAATALEGTFDHGEEGYGLWLDPAVQDDPVYAEHWAGHRPVEVAIEEDQIVIRRAGGDGDEDEDG